jgi:hypothetical protein
MTRMMVNGQLRSEILKFDLDAFITAAIKRHFFKRAKISIVFAIWMPICLTTTVRMVIPVPKKYHC